MKHPKPYDARCCRCHKRIGVYTLTLAVKCDPERVYYINVCAEHLTPDERAAIDAGRREGENHD